MIVIHFINCNYHTPENITLGNDSYVADIFFMMLNEWEKRRSVHKMKSAVYDIMQFCYEAYSQTYAYPMAEKAKQLIDSNYSNKNFNIASLAQILYTSTPTLRRNFSNRFGISPKQYLMTVRLDTAVSLLSEGFLSVRGVSEKCGFDDEHYFSRVIKSRYGKTPSKIAQNN